MARVKGKRVERRQSPTETEEALEGTAIPAAQLKEAESAPTGVGVVVAFGALVIFGLLMLGASAVPPRRVPWPVVAEPLFAHRSDLATLGIGTIAVAFLCLNAAVLL